jgi:hypothetical protein
MSEFSRKVSKVSSSLRRVDEEVLSGCVKKRVNGKMRLVSLQRWKNANKPVDVFAYCIKPYANLWCQCVLDGKVFCMETEPCWKKGGKINKKG